MPTEQVDIMAMQHKTPEYTAINPLQRMPALVLDDGTIITESIAICRYFEMLQPDPPLFGVGPKDAAVVEMWNRRGEINFLVECRGGVPSSASGDEGAGGAAGGGLGRSEQAARRPGFSNCSTANLRTREFIAGDRYTVADITMQVAVDFMKPARLAMPDGCQT